MENNVKEKNNSKGIIVLLCIIIVILLALCTLFATGTISLKSNEVIDNGNNQINDNINTSDNDSNLLNSNIIVTQNGKVISNEIPSDLVGKYVNKNSNESYIQLSNESVEVSEPTGGNATRVFKDEQVKLYINYLNTDENSKQYVTIEFYVENNRYNQKATYTYVGQKSSHDNEYHFKTLDHTPVGGEQSDYPYSK